MPLTNTSCKNAKPSEKPRKLYDSNGLYLKVMPNGSKYWRLKFLFAGKEKCLALGVYPGVSLKEAREKSDAARKLLAANIDPSQAKKEEKRKTIREELEEPFISEKSKIEALDIALGNAISCCRDEYYEKDLSNHNNFERELYISYLRKDHGVEFIIKEIKELIKLGEKTKETEKDEDI